MTRIFPLVSCSAAWFASAGGTSVVLPVPGGAWTTTLPALANQAAEQDTSGKILVTAPRRVAVRAAANRLQHLSGSVLPKSLNCLIKRNVRAC